MNNTRADYPPLPSRRGTPRLARFLFRGACVALACLVVSALLAAQAPKQPKEQKPKREAPKDLQPGQSCMASDCHDDLGRTPFLHGPVNLKQCEPCHVAVDTRHEFKKAPTGAALCLQCHETEPPKKVVHEPFKTDCSLCHNPHGGDNRYFVKGGPGAVGCILCHTDVRKGLSFLHGPVAMGECVVCHSPHQSDNAKLLIDPPGQLCLGCHVDFGAGMKGAVSVHPPARDNCAGCHGPHGGMNEYLLSATGRKLCANCHADFLKQIDEYKNRHQPMIEGKSCENCHQPHFSNQQALISGKLSDLCLGCHNKTIQVDSRTLANVAAQTEGAKYLHGPLRQGNCVACHQAHGSDFYAILNKAFPSTFYAPFTIEAYDLCFECHDKKIILQKQSADTGFRNGDVNLHYLHVNREKGRSCRACHHEHASNQPLEIRSSVPFGRWTMPVEFTKTDTGGGCQTGCHALYRYDRIHPVKNEVQEAPGT